MGSIGIEKLLLLGIALLIFFGPNKLPELGRALGKGIQEFKKASREFSESVQEGTKETKEEEKKG
jgi:sec-independent protein translocase protein TatA